MMQPDFDQRIASMIKALTETVLPVIDPKDKSAIEQLNITVGSLHLMRSQIDYAHWFEVAEANDLLDMMSSISGIVGADQEVAAIIRETSATAARYDLPLSALREANVEVRAKLTELIDRGLCSDDQMIASQVHELSLSLGKASIDRERAFVAGTHFDVFPGSLMSIQEALTKAA